jgi:NADP-dependent aldehyde dehydrogenase
MPVHPVLLAGAWRPARSSGQFQADDPSTGSPRGEPFPVSTWDDCDVALDAAAAAFDQLTRLGPEPRARFLEAFAARIEARLEPLATLAHEETGLAIRPRLAEVELPRTVNQLRLAATAAREGSWALPTIDTKLGIRSQHEPIGPVLVFGPNNFPFAFNGISGGDFAAAIAAGAPVIAKANPGHPETTFRLAELAHEAATEVGLPPGTVQLLYRTSHADGARLVSDPRLGATGYTGARHAGLALKAAADAAGKPIYLELSSVNPVVVLPGALRERSDALADEFAGSCLMGAGQFCTNPGLVLLLDGPDTERFITAVRDRFAKAPAGILLSRGVLDSLRRGVAALQQAGAECLVGGAPVAGPAFKFAPTLLRTSGAQFLREPLALQGEAFGPASLFVVAEDESQLTRVIDLLEGNLTGGFYTARDGADDPACARLEPHLRRRVGRLLNDKMPTGVAVSPAMNHGGPYPSTGHAGFTAVGIPASLRRFSVLACYDSVRPSRLPPLLQDANPTRAWRLIDGAWTRDPVGS